MSDFDVHKEGGDFTVSNTFVRESVVTNGCSGGCCEKFSFGYSLDDLIVMKKAREEGKHIFIDEQGQERRVMSDTTLDRIIEILIPLGLTEVEPNGEYRYDDKMAEWKDEVSRATENIDYLQAKLKDRELEYYKKDGKYYRRIFTCKEFDTEKRICSNYENRPSMCQTFGRECQYKGCTMVQKIAESLKKIEDEQYKPVAEKT